MAEARTSHMRLGLRDEGARASEGPLDDSAIAKREASFFPHASTVKPERAHDHGERNVEGRRQLLDARQRPGELSARQDRRVVQGANRRVDQYAVHVAAEE